MCKRKRAALIRWFRVFMVLLAESKNGKEKIVEQKDVTSDNK